jgi:hypothetical protein
MTTIVECPDTPRVVSDVAVRQPDNLPMCEVTEYVEAPVANARVFLEKNIRVNNRVVSASFNTVPIGSTIEVGMSRYTAGFRYVVADSFEATIKNRNAASNAAMQERCHDLRRKAINDVEDLSKWASNQVDAVARARRLIRETQTETQREVAIHDAFVFTKDLFAELHQRKTTLDSNFKALPYVGFDPRHALAGKKRTMRQ